ncbi:hypothetical protein LCGC14_2223480, partial [marine sediment metagenome]
QSMPGDYAPAEVPSVWNQSMPGGPTDRVAAWLAGLAGVAPDGLSVGQTQKHFRKWKRQRPGHRSFTVLRHPAPRIHAAFCTHILPASGPQVFGEIRETLRTRYDLPIPGDGPGAAYGPAEHRRAFTGFLRFVKGNLGGQTSLRVDPSWATQSALLQGMGQFMQPDMILREAGLVAGLPHLAAQVGCEGGIPIQPDAPADPVGLDAIHDAEIEALIREIYQRDYMMFGFDSYAPA